MSMTDEEKRAEIERVTKISGFRVKALGRVPKRITKKHRNRFVHSSVVFLTNTHLSAGLAGDHSARLLIRPEAPAHASDGKVKWTLEITADLAGSRDITQKKPITVTIF